MRKLERFALSHLLSDYRSQKELLRNSFTLFTGATIGQLVPFLAGPILSRLYTPEDFGFFALMSTTAGIASIVSTGSYEYAIVTANDEDADDLVLLSGTLSLLFSFISGSLLFTIISIAKPWKENPFGWVWALVPVYIFLQGFINTLNYRFNRFSGYKQMAKGKMIRDFAMTIGQLSLGLLKFRWGLLPGVVFGQASAAGFYVKKVWRDLYGSLSRISVRRMIFIAKRHYRFPVFLMPSQLINELSVHVPVYCLNFFFSNSAVGLYALPQKFLNVPVVLIGNSIGQVFYKDARTHLHSPEEIKKRTLSLFKMLFYISVIPFSIILVFGDSIIGWAFGQDWLQSGIYAQYLSPWLMFVLIGSPISRLFTVLDKQKLSLWLNIILFNLRVVGLAIGTFIFNSAEMAVKLFAITGAFYWIFLSFYTLYMAKVNMKPVILNTLIVWLTVLMILFSIRMILPY